MEIAKLNSRNRRAGKKARIEVPVVVPAPPEQVARLQTIVPGIKLDIGCGPNKKPGFIGVDQYSFPGVDVVTDLNKAWPWEDNSVEEASSSHCLEHFDAMERVHFLNELYRVLKPGAKATIAVPHWASCRAYGDPTHKWPPMSEFAFYYWKKDWRLSQAPHSDAANLTGGFNCNFDVQWGYTYHPEVGMKNQEYIQFAQNFYKEAIWDMVATLTALK